MLLHSTVDYKLLSSIKRQNRKMRITEGNSEMIRHNREMDKDWSSCHSRVSGNPEPCCHVEPQGDILYSILRHTGEGRCPVCIG